ncbi:hypothetical protein JCM10207_007105 [Rhodosporidiobolus poonsookiae]
MTYSRTSVLFPHPTSFPSRDAFFSACHDRLLQAYGYTTSRYRNESEVLVACCVQRKSLKCKFRVCAKRENGTWSLSQDETDWVHSHVADFEAHPEPSRRAEKEVKAESEPEEDEDSDSSLTSLSSDDDEADSPSTSSQPKPAMPQPGDRFTTTTACRVAASASLLASHGYSVSPYNEKVRTITFRCNRAGKNYVNAPGGACNFQLKLKKDIQTNEWVVQRDKTKLTHNHGPRDELVADPSWRPIIVNEDVRAAMGLPPGKRARDKLQAEKQVRSKKRKRKSNVRLPASSEHEAKPTPTGLFATSTAQPQPMQTPPSFSLFPSAHPPPPIPLPFAPHSTASPSAPPFISPPPVPYPPQARASSAPSPLSALSASSQNGSSVVDHLSSSALSSFLAALHPSLASLAPHLASAGIDSISSLADLALFEQSTLDALLELVVQRSEDDKTRPIGAEKVSVVQLKIFARAVREGREQGWPA